jgi:hypothetical protein
MMTVDAPYIAKKTGATIIGSETVANLARAYDVMCSSLWFVEARTMRLGVLPEGDSHHSLRTVSQALLYFSSRLAGNALPGLKAPLKAGDFVEGQNMAYLLRLAGREVPANLLGSCP